MKQIIQKSLPILCLFFVARCALNPSSKKNLPTPLEERLLSMEERIKVQAREIASLHSVVTQIEKKAETVKEPLNLKGRPQSATPTLGALTSSDSEAQALKKLPTTKIKAEDNDNVPSVSPLMDDSETIADSSHQAMNDYYKGIQFFNEKKYEDAIDSFRIFVNENPHHVYADRAQFLISNIHFKNEDYGMVIVSTNSLQAKYPYSLKIPEAIYQRGVSFIEMNEIAQAKLTFTELMKNFPKDPMANAARKKWVELTKEPKTRIH
ncbi:MAG: outer membrane protein assembly factor BamD [Bdellovibrionales bacterium]|nr:outer membrane protein assembly factor BamD [Bdellovibrionales bacterium]